MQGEARDQGRERSYYEERPESPERHLSGMRNRDVQNSGKSIGSAYDYFVSPFFIRKGPLFAHNGVKGYCRVFSLSLLLPGEYRGTIKQAG